MRPSSVFGGRWGGTVTSRVPLGRPLWIFSAATTFSIAGAFVQKIAVGWVVWQTTHSTTWLAAASAADMVPTLLVSFPAGAAVDRLGPKVTFWGSQVASCLQSLVLFALAALGHLTISALLICSVFLGTCNAFVLPSRIAYMMQLVPKEAYKRAVVVYSIGTNAAFVVGPMVGSTLISTLGVKTAFGVNTLAFLPIIAVASFLPAVRMPLDRIGGDDGVITQIRQGIHHAIKNRAIFIMLLSFLSVAVTARGIMELAPSIAALVLLGGVKTLSWLMSAIAIGALVGGLCASFFSLLKERTLIILTMTGASIGLFGYGTSNSLILALSTASVLGFMLALNNITVTSAIQLHVDLQFRGRINSLYNMIFKGGPALGSAGLGMLAHVENIRLATAVAAIALFLFMLVILGIAKLRARDSSPVGSEVHG
jgi:MFS family permease